MDEGSRVELHRQARNFRVLGGEREREKLKYRWEEMQVERGVNWSQQIWRLNESCELQFASATLKGRSIPVPPRELEGPRGRVGVE